MTNDKEISKPDISYSYKHSEVREFDRYLDYSMNISVDTVAILVAYKQQVFSEIDNLKQVLHQLTETEYFDKKEINIYILDIEKFPKAIDEYKLNKDFQFVILYNSVPHEMQNFAELWQLNKEQNKHQNLHEQILKYVQKIQQEITIELQTLKQIEQKLQQESIMAIYLGPNDHYWNLYSFFAQQHSDKKFYHCHDRSVAHKLFRKYAKEEFPKDKHVFAILRSKNLLDEFDDKQLVYMHHLFSDSAMKTFYDYEMYPKLRNDQYTDDNITQMFNNPSENIVLYIIGETQNEQNKKEFAESVKDLPKKFIYTWIHINSLKFYKYIELFQLAKKEWQPEKIYILNVDKAKQIYIQEMQSEITKVNINHFVFDFHKRKYYKDEEQSSGDQLHNDEL